MGLGIVAINSGENAIQPEEVVMGTEFGSRKHRNKWTGVAMALLCAAIIAPNPAAAVLPVPTSCQFDAQGANDQPG